MFHVVIVALNSPVIGTTIDFKSPVRSRRSVIRKTVVRCETRYFLTALPRATPWASQLGHDRFMSSPLLGGPDAVDLRSCLRRRLLLRLAVTIQAKFAPDPTELVLVKISIAVQPSDY